MIIININSNCPIIVITFYLSSCLGLETAKGPISFRIKLPPAHQSTTHGGSFTLSLLLLNVVNTNLNSLWFDPTGNRARVYRSRSRRSMHSTSTDRNIITCSSERKIGINYKFWHNILTLSMSLIQIFVEISISIHNQL